jgi:hypothetical protein
VQAEAPFAWAVAEEPGTHRTQWAEDPVSRIADQEDQIAVAALRMEGSVAAQNP